MRAAAPESALCWLRTWYLGLRVVGLQVGWGLVVLGGLGQVGWWEGLAGSISMQGWGAGRTHRNGLVLPTAPHAGLCSLTPLAAPPGNYTSRVWEYSSTIQSSDDGPAVQGSSSFSLKGELSPPCPAFPVSPQALRWPPLPPSAAAHPVGNRAGPESRGAASIPVSAVRGGWAGACFSKHWSLTTSCIVREGGMPHPRHPCSCFHQT